MKSLEKALDIICVVLTIVFLLSTTIMVIGQLACVFMLNGEASAALLSLVMKRASMVSALTTVVALVLAYLRGQMKGDD